MTPPSVESGTGGVLLTVHQVARRPLQVVLSTTLVVGRDCDGLLIADPQASRQHAEFRLIDGRVTVRDMGSANGTMLDGNAVSGETFAEAGATVVVGTTRVTIGAVTTLSAERLRVEEVRPKSSIMKLSEALEADPVAAAPAVERRTGTFTIVFSDIEGSTAYATRVGDTAWMLILDRHESLIRSTVHDHGGRVVKNQGDGFMLTFDSARRAVAFAVAVQRRFEAERHADPHWHVSVRIGIHAGEAITTADGDLFGRHVMVASRIADHARGGEILASAIVRDLTAGSAECEFETGRSVALKGIGEQVIHRIGWTPALAESG